MMEIFFAHNVLCPVSWGLNNELYHFDTIFYCNVIMIDFDSLLNKA